MIRQIALVFSLGLGACIFNPARGSRPADMTAQGHVQECRDLEQHAKEADKRADETPPGEGNDGGFRERYVAQIDRDAATQHGAAARAVDPHAPRCP